MFSLLECPLSCVMVMVMVVATICFILFHFLSFFSSYYCLLSFFLLLLPFCLLYRFLPFLSLFFLLATASHSSSFCWGAISVWLCRTLASVRLSSAIGPLSRGAIFVFVRPRLVAWLFLCLVCLPVWSAIYLWPSMSMSFRHRCRLSVAVCLPVTGLSVWSDCRTVPPAGRFWLSTGAVHRLANCLQASAANIGGHFYVRPLCSTPALPMAGCIRSSPSFWAVVWDPLCRLSHLFAGRQSVSAAVGRRRLRRPTNRPNVSSTLTSGHPHYFHFGSLCRFLLRLWSDEKYLRAVRVTNQNDKKK